MPRVLSLSIVLYGIPESCVREREREREKGREGGRLRERGREKDTQRERERERESQREREKEPDRPIFCKMASSSTQSSASPVPSGSHPWWLPCEEKSNLKSGCMFAVHE
jgi:hypothetical protein